jgi:hypothetical protein
LCGYLIDQCAALVLLADVGGDGVYLTELRQLLLRQLAGIGFA